jgi:putative RecB family exonuclease
VAIYSHSRLSTYEKCPLQYRYRYLDRIQRDTQSIEAYLGQRVHEVLETLYRDLRTSTAPSLDALLALYHRRWNEEFSGKVTIVRTELGAEHYRRAGEECVTKFYRRHHPFDDGTTLGLEDRITVWLDAAGRYQLQGYIDRLVGRGGGVYEIHDYKTSGFLPSDAHLRRDRQLTVYRMAVEKRYPDAREIRLVWHYLLFDRTLTSDRTQHEIEQHRRQTIRLIDTIEEARVFPPRESALCRWCEYRDICPLFATPGPPEERRPVRWLDKAEQMSLF